MRAPSCIRLVFATPGGRGIRALGALLGLASAMAMAVRPAAATVDYLRASFEAAANFRSARFTSPRFRHASASFGSSRSASV